MKLLVAGADRVDAGKTTFSTGLVAHTGAHGFKPRAGNNYWFDQDDYLKATRDGRLYGKDARRLAEFVVNGTVDVPDSAAERLPLSAAPRVTSLPDFNDLMRAMHADALADLREDIAAADRAVVESYGDIARPLSGFEPDAVAVVEPGRARFYDGRRYAKACEIATGSPGEGQLEERVENVVDLIDRTGAVRLPALDGETRADPEAVADAYDHAYDALLAAAFD